MLTLIKSEGGSLRLTYQGPVEVSGVSVTQTLDLTALSKSVREQPYFKRSIVIWARPVSPGLTAVEADVTFSPPTGVPTSCTITLTASDAEDVIALDLWVLHSFIGLVADATKLYFIGAGGGGGGAVSSVFGRIGAVVAVAGDYLASQVDNDSSVAGSTVADALDNLLALVTGSLNVRTTLVTAAVDFNDYLRCDSAAPADAYNVDFPLITAADVGKTFVLKIVGNSPSVTPAPAAGGDQTGLIDGSPPAVLSASWNAQRYIAVEHAGPTYGWETL